MLTDTMQLQCTYINDNVDGMESVLGRSRLKIVKNVVITSDMVGYSFRHNQAISLLKLSGNPVWIGISVKVISLLNINIFTVHGPFWSL